MRNRRSRHKTRRWRDGCGEFATWFSPKGEIIRFVVYRIENNRLFTLNDKVVLFLHMRAIVKFDTLLLGLV